MSHIAWRSDKIWVRLQDVGVPDRASQPILRTLYMPRLVSAN